ncbi:MAG TPA: YihY/virulence factor BrkB family protein [Holophagaceae bacterium]|nr:YihY/virulence factor BrkB family protein [Holophagaceae bacterium]
MVEKVLGRWPHLVTALEAAWHRFEQVFPLGGRVARFCWEVARKFQKDDCLSYAAGLSFWLTVSLVPLATLLFKVLVLVLGSKAYAQSTQGLLESLIPYLPDTFVEDIIKNSQKLNGVWFSWFVLIFGSYWGISQLDTTLAHVFGTRAKKHRETRKNHFIRQISILLGGIVVLVAFMVLLVGGLLHRFFGFKTGVLIPFLTPLLGFVVVAAILQHLPRIHVKLKHALLGAAISSGFWWLAKWGFGVYLEHTMTWGIMYGSLLGIVAGLTFLYYSCAIFLLGAEVTAAFYRHETGTHPIPKNLLKGK